MMFLVSKLTQDYYLLKILLYPYGPDYLLRSKIVYFV